MKKTLIIAVLLLNSACAMVTPTFVGIPLQSKDIRQVQTYYREQDVPYRFRVIGKVYVKNINYWADRAPGKQAQAIQREAAQAGADGVIIEESQRIESSEYSSGQVYQLSGIAIARMEAN